MNSVPFPGAIFLRPCNEYSKTKHSSRPLSGVSIFLLENFPSNVKSKACSRPLSGVSIFLQMELLAKKKAYKSFSSPFRGFYLSTGDQKNRCLFYNPFSSPFRGFYLSTLQGVHTNQELQFSSPFRGFYLSTFQKALLKARTLFSSPFQGFYLSTE